MRSTLCLFFFLFTGFGLNSKADAGLIIGNIYQDSDNLDWKYIGSFNVTDGPHWSIGVQALNGLEAAELLFGALSPGLTYATSTSDTFVDHLAWYDGWGQTQHLNILGSGNVGLPEDIIADPGNDGYTFEGYGLGDFSTYVSDHVDVASNSINYVFVSVPASQAAVPEPSSFAIFGVMGFAGFIARMRKRR